MEWISVEDRLPEGETVVLVVGLGRIYEDNDPFLFLCQAYKVDDFWVDSESSGAWGEDAYGDQCIIRNPILYWMPIESLLPPIPEKYLTT